MNIKFSRLLTAICGGLFLVGCGSKDKDPYLNMKPEKIYNIGRKNLEKGDQKDAIKAFESLSSQYPFNSYTQKGNSDVIYAYYLDDDSAMTLASTARYLKLYPSSPNSDYAYYMQGVENYNNGRGFLQRHFPYDMSQHDASGYKDAYNAFYKVVVLYPNSKYAKDSRRRMIYLKNVMAKYQLGVSEYYYQMKAYVASISRSKEIVLHYPRTTSVQPALEIMYHCYQQLNLPDYANQINQVYKANYGQSLSKSIKK